jgi:hypothetical protein
MPTNATLAQPFQTRTCSANIAHSEPVTLPLTEANFFHRRRANGTLYIESRCQACRRMRDREVRRLRAAGMPVRACRATRTLAERRFGIEIEYIGRSSEVAREMEARGVRCSVEDYNHRVRPGWKIVRDASVSGGFELVSPPLRGEEGLRQLKVACDALDAAGARVDRQCGLHIHHDVRDLDAPAFGRLFRGWSRNQSNTDMLVAASRRGSRWAMPLTEREVRRIEELPSLDDATVRAYFNSYRIDRYRSLNVVCFPRYGTVEVRQHQGSLNYSKISAWVAYGQAMIAAAVAGDVAAETSAEALLDKLAADGHMAAETATYLKTRAAHFAGRVAAAA